MTVARPTNQPRSPTHADEQARSVALDLEASGPEREWSHTQFANVLAVCAVDGADAAVLGAAFRTFEQDLGMTPMMLGAMVLAQALATSAAAPLWGWMCDTGFASRRALFSAGTLGWAAMMMALSVASSLPMIILVRIFNGVFLACLGPLTQSWVAERVNFADSGRMFSFLSAATAVGAALSVATMTKVGTGRQVIGPLGEVADWRLACVGIGVASLVLSATTLCSMDGDARRPSGTKNISIRASAGEIVQSLREHWGIYTFRIIVFQGVVGAIPWSALAFKLMFFQYLGMSSSQVNTIVAAEVVPKILGGMIGGFLGDYAAKLSPRHGRAVVGQIAIGCGIPLQLYQILVLPRLVGAQSVLPYILANTTFTLIAGWAPTGVIRPLFLEITKPGSRASILAWEFALEGSSAAILGAPMVGLLAENLFLYRPTTADVATMDPVLRSNNFAALQWSLVVMTTVPWLLCFVAISWLHYSYQHDLDRQGQGVSGLDATMLVKRGKLAGASKDVEEDAGLECAVGEYGSTCSKNSKSN